MRHDLPQAEQLADVPQINPAVVQSLRGGIYMNIIGGAFSQCALLQLVPWMWRTDVRQIRGPASLRNTASEPEQQPFCRPLLLREVCAAFAVNALLMPILHLRRIIVRNKLQQSLTSLRTMMTQVRAALDWLSRPRSGMY